MHARRLVLIGSIVLLGLCAGTGIGWTQTLTRVDSTFTPWGVAVGGNGDVYFTSPATGQVLKLVDGTGSPVVVATGLNVVFGVGVGSNGDVYIAESGGGWSGVQAGAGHRESDYGLHWIEQPARRGRGKQRGCLYL